MTRTVSFAVRMLSVVALFVSAQIVAAQNIAPPITSGGLWTERVLRGFNFDSMGCVPYDGLIFDVSGNAYSTASLGGAYGQGVVFELIPVAFTWKEKVLHDFGQNSDGAQPFATLTVDTAGNLYGTTVLGGTYGVGAVFELKRNPNATGGGWTERVLHSFNHDGTDGWYVVAGVVLDAAGNLYGTTVYGGTYDSGTVYKLSRSGDGSWTEQVLYSFNPNIGDGADPYGGLILDNAGNLYGTTRGGTVFELSPTAQGWTEHVLHSFGGPGDGSVPNSSLILDSAGNLYGTTIGGGTYNGGTVFELTPSTDGSWTEQVLHNFGDGTDGAAPWGGLTLDAAGNLYGTTREGGTYTCYGTGCGTVFELTPTVGGGWTEQVLHNFGDDTDGVGPTWGSLVFDAGGNLYGTTGGGGPYGWGTVFELLHH